VCIYILTHRFQNVLSGRYTSDDIAQAQQWLHQQHRPAAAGDALCHLVHAYSCMTIHWTRAFSTQLTHVLRACTEYESRTPP